MRPPRSIETHPEDTPPTGRFPDSGRAGRVPRGRGKKGTDQSAPGPEERPGKRAVSCLRPVTARSTYSRPASLDSVRLCAHPAQAAGRGSALPGAVCAPRDRVRPLFSVCSRHDRLRKCPIRLDRPRPHQPCQKRAAGVVSVWSRNSTATAKGVGTSRGADPQPAYINFGDGRNRAVRYAGRRRVSRTSQGAPASAARMASSSVNVPSRRRPSQRRVRASPAKGHGSTMYSVPSSTAGVTVIVTSPSRLGTPSWACSTWSPWQSASAIPSHRATRRRLRASTSGKTYWA